MGHVGKILLITCGWVSLLLGVLGIFLPLLPTTPFVILAGFCFSKGSKKMHNWLLNLRTFGPILRNWEEHGVIAPKAKMISVSMIFILFSYTLIFVPVEIYIKGIIASIGVGVVWFILSRPSYQKRSSNLE